MNMSAFFPSGLSGNRYADLVFNVQECLSGNGYLISIYFTPCVQGPLPLYPLPVFLFLFTLAFVCSPLILVWLLGCLFESVPQTSASLFPVSVAPPPPPMPQLTPQIPLTGFVARVQENSKSTSMPLSMTRVAPPSCVRGERRPARPAPGLADVAVSVRTL